MDRETIIKALECISRTEDVLCEGCDYRKYDGLACHRIGAKNALALIKELTEENEKLLTALANYDRQTDVRIAEEYYTAEAYEELREENEKLMSTSSFQGAIIGSLQVAANELTTDKERLEKLLDDKCDRCIERERADTVKEVQTELSIHFGTYTDKTTVKVCDLFKVMGEIAEKILNETEDDLK